MGGSVARTGRGASTPLSLVVFWVSKAGTAVALVPTEIRTSMPGSVGREGVAGWIVASMSLVPRAPGMN